MINFIKVIYTYKPPSLELWSIGERHRDLSITQSSVLKVSTRVPLLFVKLIDSGFLCNLAKDS